MRILDPRPKSFSLLFCPPVHAKSRAQVRPGGDPPPGNPPPGGGGRHVEAAGEGPVPAVQRAGDGRARRRVSPPGSVHGLRGAARGQLPGVRRPDHGQGGEDLQHMTWKVMT